MSNTIFSKILSKEIPNHTVFQNEHVLAFLDIFPHAKGHTVVIPKKEVEFIEELTDQEIAHFFVGVKETMAMLQKILKPKGFNVGWNHGEVAGQAVKHLHVHIMPRWSDDGGGSQHSIINNPGDIDVKEVAKLFIKK